MKYETQIEALRTIARRGIEEAGESPPCNFEIRVVVEWIKDLCPEPRAFIAGAIRRGWLTITGATGNRVDDDVIEGQIGVGGQLMVSIMRSEWQTICPSLRVWLKNLVAVLEDCLGETDLAMDELSSKASIDNDWRDMVWSTLLAAVPGIASQTTVSTDGKRTIRLTSSMLDQKLLLHLIDVERPMPHPLSMPLEVT